MTKEAALAKIKNLYRVLNLADSDSDQRAEWTTPAMAGPAGCALLDKLLHAWVREGVITADDLQYFHDTL
jgi:hypothetical protein